MLERVLPDVVLAVLDGVGLRLRRERSAQEEEGKKEKQSCLHCMGVDQFLFSFVRVVYGLRATHGNNSAMQR